jgi:hypothetical protein
MLLLCWLLCLEPLVFFMQSAQFGGESMCASLVSAVCQVQGFGLCIDAILLHRSFLSLACDSVLIDHLEASNVFPPTKVGRSISA